MKYTEVQMMRARLGSGQCKTAATDVGAARNLLSNLFQSNLSRYARKAMDGRYIADKSVSRFIDKARGALKKYSLGYAPAHDRLAAAAQSAPGFYEGALEGAKEFADWRRATHAAGRAKLGDAGMKALRLVGRIEPANVGIRGEFRDLALPNKLLG